VLAAVASLGPGEGLWYSAGLYIIELDSGNTRELYVPQDQLGWPAASASGRHLAVVEALCSDRWIVAGELRLIDMSSGSVHNIDTAGIDVTHTEWCTEDKLLLAGHRDLETVVGVYDVTSSVFREVWCSQDVTCAGRYAVLSRLNEAGDCALVGESFVRAPEIGVIRNGIYHTVRSFDLGYTVEAKAIQAVEQVTWSAPDGLRIRGMLLRPQGNAPYPTVMIIHGGPVWHWRPFWLGRSGLFALILLQLGYAVFFPNPRGSSGRGIGFAKRVVGDIGGADVSDYLSGLDHLVAYGISDPLRLGVTGGSYGGYMTACLITSDSRFAAAVAFVPSVNRVSQHLTCAHPHYLQIFLDDSYTNLVGKYFERSPIFRVHKVKTPTLNICGALDRCTPPEEALQFHRALLEHDVKSILITYPEEGHGIQRLPAAVDYVARLVAWFDEHMRAYRAT
jgi:dipeptidyl aminopeptidase/acylaminoacyl peptidase